MDDNYSNYEGQSVINVFEYFLLLLRIFLKSRGNSTVFGTIINFAQPLLQMLCMFEYIQKETIKPVVIYYCLVMFSCNVV